VKSDATFDSDSYKIKIRPVPTITKKSQNPPTNKRNNICITLWYLLRANRGLWPYKVVSTVWHLV